jgi:hypothetical protein
MKYLVSIKTEIAADNLEEAQDKANNINMYFNLRNGGNELDPSVTNVEPLGEMATDEVVDHYSEKFATAYLHLENALDQDVTFDQIDRIKATVMLAKDKLNELLMEKINKLQIK